MAVTIIFTALKATLTEMQHVSEIRAFVLLNMYEFGVGETNCSLG